MVIEADETYISGKAANRAYGLIHSFHAPNVAANNLDRVP
jgi:hypothetical protein